VVIEAIFGIPGIGSALTNAVGSRDYPVIQGIAVVAAICVVLANLLADVVYTVADPRTRR
jgi:peptide/nickel transport system permease protein